MHILEEFQKQIISIVWWLLLAVSDNIMQDIDELRKELAS